MRPIDSEPIALGTDALLPRFALSDESCRLLDQGREGSCALVQLRADDLRDATRPGTLLGVLSACSPHPVTPRQVRLLRTLARLASLASESARSERLRSQIISSVSHELRTPLAAIRAYNELLLDGDVGPVSEEQQELLSRIETLCLQLDQLIDDLLDLSRLRAGELSVRKAPVDVAAVTEHIIDTMRPEADRVGITVRADIQEELPPLQADPDRLAQVLFNLVGNAVKYLPGSAEGAEGGRVVVRAWTTGGEEGGDLVIAVEDNGPGIIPEDLDRIFDEFYRGRAAERTKGAGLGLSIASRLTRLMGGSLKVESTPGEGSTFSLRFPQVRQRAGA